MRDAYSAGIIFLMLCTGAVLGQVIIAILPERHRQYETIEFTRLVTGLLITFTALVLSLLLTSVNSSFERTENDLRTFSSDLMRLTTCLDEYGPKQTALIRAGLRGYA